MRPLLLSALVAVTGCMSPTPEPASTPASENPFVPSFVACSDAARKIDATVEPVITDATRAPGRTLFADSGKLLLVERGQAGQVATPYPIREHSAQLTSDGRVVALLRGPDLAEAYLWELTPSGAERLVKMPAPFGNSDYVIWSPGMTRAVWAHGEFGSDMTFSVVDLNGTIASAKSAAPDPFYLAAWRTDDELTLVSAPAKPSTNQSWPLKGAVLWTWSPPNAPVRRSTDPIDLVTWPAWAADGETLATLELKPNGSAVVLRSGTGTRTLLTTADLQRGPNGCVRTATLMGLSWSPDGSTLAIHGRGDADFAAFAGVRGERSIGLFTLPVGRATCYIPGTVGWTGSVAVVPVYGLDCGVRDPFGDNAIAVVDPKSGSLLGYRLIGRKGFLGVSGGWAIAQRHESSTDFIDLTRNGLRLEVPFSGFAGHCCGR
jgi:hypothetical protein